MNTGLAIPGIRPLRRRWRRATEAWLSRRVPEEVTTVRLHRRRLYILPTRLGYTFAVVVLALLLGSMNYNSSIGFGVTFLLAGIGLLGMLHTHRNLNGLTVRFGNAPPVFAGHPARFPLTLEAGDRERWSIEFEAGTDTLEPLSVPADMPLRTRIEIGTSHRGRLTMPRLVVRSRWPVGLYRVWSWLRPAVDCTVYPAPIDHGRPVPWMMAAESTGKSQARSDEEHFMGLRSYQPGDPPRRIAWKVLARTDRLYSQTFDQRGARIVWLDSDDLPGLDFERRLEQICHWILAANAAGHRFGLRLPDQRIEPDCGTGHVRNCLEALAFTAGGRA